MKIPVYQNQMPYRGSYARGASLARPVKEASGSDRWFDLAAVAQGLKIGVKGYEKVKQFSKELFSDIVEEQTHFSSDNRAELLSFCQNNIFSLASQSQDTAVDKLDQYVSDHADRFEKNDLLAQDYAILRRCAADLEENKRAEIRQARHAQAATVFLKTASAVRGANALDEYIKSNLSMATREMIADGVDEPTCKEQEKQLRQTAVTQNITSALQAGQVREAEDVCRHFSADIEPKKATLLTAQIMQAKAEQYAEKIPAHQQTNWQNNDGTISWKKVEKYVKNLSLPETEKETYTQVVFAHLSEKNKASFRQEATVYKTLLENPSSTPTLFIDDNFPSERFKSLQKASLSLRSGSGKENPTLFNHLYENAVSGNIKRSEIDACFEEEKLNAREYLLLSHQFCQKQAGENDPNEILLWQALEGLCRNRKQTSAQKQALKYMVYTSGTELPQRLASAERATQILRLEEGKK